MNYNNWCLWINVWNDCSLKYSGFYFLLDKTKTKHLHLSHTIFTFLLHSFFLSTSLSLYTCLSVYFSLSLSSLFILIFPDILFMFWNTVTKPTHLELDNGQVQSHSTNGKSYSLFRQTIIKFISLSNYYTTKKVLVIQIEWAWFDSNRAYALNIIIFEWHSVNFILISIGHFLALQLHFPHFSLPNFIRDFFSTFMIFVCVLFLFEGKNTETVNWINPFYPLLFVVLFSLAFYQFYSSELKALEFIQIILKDFYSIDYCLYWLHH